MNNPNDYLVGLDIGSHKVLCVVALPSPKGEGLYRICGYSFRDSHGVRNGIVTDLNAAVDDIKAGLERTGVFSAVEVKDAKPDPKGGIDFRMTMKLNKAVQPSRSRR